MCRYICYKEVFNISLYFCKRTLRRVYTCARVCAECSLALGDKAKRGGGSTSLCRVLVADVGGYVDKKKDRGVVCIFCIFDRGWSFLLLLLLLLQK